MTKGQAKVKASRLTARGIPSILVQRKDRRGGWGVRTTAAARNASSKWRSAHLDQSRAFTRSYQAQHPEKKKEWARKYRETPREDIKAYGRRYYQLNRDKCLARVARYSRTIAGQTVHYLAAVKHNAKRRVGA